MYDNLGITGDRNLLVCFLVLQRGQDMLILAKVTGIYNCVGPVASTSRVYISVLHETDPVQICYLFSSS
jgi:hypothetical protein